MASRWNRATRSASAANASGRTLIATSRSSRVSRARYTSPMPPAPRAETISYGPKRAPGMRATGIAVDYMGGKQRNEITPERRRSGFRCHAARSENTRRLLGSNCGAALCASPCDYSWYTCCATIVTVWTPLFPSIWIDEAENPLAIRDCCRGVSWNGTSARLAPRRSATHIREASDLRSTSASA